MTISNPSPLMIDARNRYFDAAMTMTHDDALDCAILELIDDDLIADDDFAANRAELESLL